MDAQGGSSPGGNKRPRPDDAPLDVDGVCEFLTAALGGSAEELAPVLQAVRDNEIDGEVGRLP